MRKTIEPSVKAHASIESQKQCGSKLNDEYKTRLEKYIEKSLIEPFIRYKDEAQDHSKKYIAVKSCDLYMNHKFSFYHHQPKAVINYAIEHRGDWDRLLDEMEGLRVYEYPVPFSVDERKVYMVGQNGNHRSAVFKAIGLPDIMLNRVSKFESFNIDQDSISQYHISLINLLKHVDLLHEHEGNYLDVYGYLIWIMPDPGYRCNQISQIIDLCARARWVNEIFSDRIPPKYKFLESEELVIKKLSEGMSPFAKFINDYLLLAQVNFAKLFSKSNTLEKARRTHIDRIIEALN